MVPLPAIVDFVQPNPHTFVYFFILQKVSNMTFFGAAINCDQVTALFLTDTSGLIPSKFLLVISKPVLCSPLGEGKTTHRA